MKNKSQKTLSRDSLLLHRGRDSSKQHGFVNSPAWRGSTVIFDDLATMLHEKPSFRYGTHGNPATVLAEDLILDLLDLSGGKVCFQPSGLAAIAVPLMGMLDAGDHILVTDSIYEPNRMICNARLSKMGVKVEFYPSNIGKDIEKLMRPETKMVFLESPGSLTMDLQDVPAITAVARKHGVVSIIDDTWSSFIGSNPFKLGADIAVYALTKYPLGHSDALLGAVVANEKYADQVKQAQLVLGQCPGSHEMEMLLRGMRTLALRYRHQSQVALHLASWLEGHEAVENIYHLALPSHPDHATFQRDFDCAAGLFSFTLKGKSDGVSFSPNERKALDQMFDNTNVCSMGYSWGGYETLMAPVIVGTKRKHPSLLDNHTMVRIGVGLEDVKDIQDDIDAALARYLKAWKA